MVAWGVIRRPDGAVRAYTIVSYVSVSHCGEMEHESRRQDYLQVGWTIVCIPTSLQRSNSRGRSRQGSSASSPSSIQRE